MEEAKTDPNRQSYEASSGRWVRTDGSRVIRQGKSGTCPPPWLPVLLASHQSAPPTRRRLVDNVFTSTAKLKTAAQEYNANPTAAIAKYGPITNWDVSAITDMSGLFGALTNFNIFDSSGLFGALTNFNANISSWDTSGVTSMNQMFYVRSTAALRSACTLLAPSAFLNHELRSPCPCCPAPNLQSSPFLHAVLLHRGRPPPLPPPGPPLCRTASSTSFDPRQGASAFNQPLSFNTSSVTDMSYMFGVRSSPCPVPPVCDRALSCTLRAPRSSAAPRLITRILAPHSVPSFRLSAVRVGV